MARLYAKLETGFVLDDPRMRNRTPEQRDLYLTLWCIAVKCRRNRLPPDYDLSYVSHLLRRRTSKVEKDLEVLAAGSEGRALIALDRNPWCITVINADAVHIELAWTDPYRPAKKDRGKGSIDPIKDLLKSPGNGNGNGTGNGNGSGSGNRTGREPADLPEDGPGGTVSVGNLQFLDEPANRILMKTKPGRKALAIDIAEELGVGEKRAYAFLCVALGAKPRSFQKYIGRLMAKPKWMPPDKAWAEASQVFSGDDL